MKIDLIDIKKFIVVNNLKEVTDTLVFDRGNVPTPNGLLSTEIFGTTSAERKETFAFIRLNGHFFHPYVYKLLKRLDRRFEHIVYGSKKYSIKKGELVEDEENGGTGLEWLYSNWDQISFKRNYSTIRNERVDLLEAYDKNTIFCEYWIVVPAFYRDVNFQNVGDGKLSHNDLTDLYAKLIKFTNMLSNTNNFDFVLNTTRSKIQEALVEIYNYFKGKQEKKGGMLRKSLLGKSIDYGARSVISAPVFDANKWNDMKVDFYHAGIPLAQCCSLFTPFIVNWVKRFFQRNLEQLGGKFLIIDKKTNEKKYVKLKDPAIHFNDEYIKKKVDRFVFSYTDRFERIELPIDDDTVKDKFYLSFYGRYYQEGKPETESPLADRHLTWCDLLYQAAVEVTKDKHVFITRYPLLDYFGTFPNKITVLSTIKTQPIFLDGKVYSHYPSIDLNMTPEQVSTYFLDTITMSNLYLAGLGGDYDGDMITCKALFSQEANEEADRILKSKAHILNIYGENMRKTTNEGIQTIYMMTKFKEKNSK